MAATMVLHDSRAQQNENTTRATTSQAGGQPDEVDRGKYIVHHVAMCIYCHTPRDERGMPDEQQLLQGAPMPVESPFPERKWAFQAPKIAGLPGGWTHDDMIRFLQTGESPTGRQPQPPMPPFRFTADDARAVAAYLESLR
jgi:mono/diheme cytochrome c family protein